MIGVDAMIIRVIYCRKISDVSVVANFDRVLRNNGDSLIDKDPFTNFESSVRCCAYFAASNAASYH